MKFYMAPMEGITGYIYRNAYHRHFHNIDKYFTPFLASRKLGQRELYEILPEHNAGMQVVPQILANQAEVFCDIAEAVGEYGYKTVNLNLGCPSSTVVAKGRGAGFLAYPEKLEHFLDDIFERCPLGISIKTRIGVDDPEEWKLLLKLYEKYPLEELIIHPRLQRDYYKNKPDWNAFAQALRESRHPLCYNGDIFTAQDLTDMLSRAKQENESGQIPACLNAVMLGRGILKNPGLTDELRDHGKMTDIRRIRAFHDDILQGYLKVMPGDKPVLFKMKELWAYLADYFGNPEKPLKQIRKSKHLTDYELAVNALFDNCRS